MTTVNSTYRPRQAEFCCIEEMQETSEAAGWTIEYSQIQSGVLLARARIIQIGALSLQEQSADRRLEVLGESPLECVSLLIPSEHTAMRVNGHKADGNHIVLLQPGEAMQLYSGEDASLLTIHLPVAQLKELCQSETWLPDTVARRRVISLRLTSGEARRLKLLTFGTMYETPTSSWSREREGKYVASVCNIIETATQLEERVFYDYPKGPLHIVDRAREFIESNLDKPIAMGDLCSYAAVSMTKLERLFKHEIGVTPSGYILSRRLAAINRELKQINEKEKRITDIAMNHGFTHLGRFAAAYCRQYGELPSETLRRNT